MEVRILLMLYLNMFRLCYEVWILLLLLGMLYLHYWLP